MRTTSAAGRVHERDYDPAGRLVEERFSVGDGEWASRRYSEEVFSWGRRRSTRDENGVWTHRDVDRRAG